ncbi:MAG TPA: DUF1615 domain-containing protein [Usitatibacter sp.]|nr:DUF1615 domain-containing protein [Usitatibacter sp.]
MKGFVMESMETPEAATSRPPSSAFIRVHLRKSLSVALLAALLAGCATSEAPREPEGPRLTAAEGRALVSRHLPRGLKDRAGWATDIYAAFAALQVRPSPENVCAVIAVTEQESGFQVDPVVPNLAAITWKEIDRQRERAGVPKLVLQAALALSSSDGRSYSDRLDAARTEHELSDVFEDFVDRVPLGRKLLADRNPVRTGGPMQVGVAFANAHAKSRPYPYRVEGSIREEVFSRRGGVYFGTAHLFDYAAPYEGLVYRYADYNAGHYASRNAAFQKAVTDLTGIPLQLDGDLVPREGNDSVGTTETAARVLASRLGMTPAEIRRDLELESRPDFEKSRLYARVFALADRLGAAPAPRAVLPQIDLKSPKFTRKLTTEWFARRVADRHRACLARGAAA